MPGSSAWPRRTPTATLLVLATFIGMALGPMLAARLPNGGPWPRCFGPRAALLRHFAIAAVICAC